ncbi:MAG TPA: glycosyltransferase family 1 protein [Candidatus Dormibacteraeota bacterium]
MGTTVAVDANPLTRHVITGTEHYARELCTRLPAAAPDLDFVFYAARPAADSGLDLTVAPFPRLWTQLRLPLELSRARPDLLFVPAHAVPFLTRRPAVLTVHDLAYERFPHAYRPAELAYLKAAISWAERRCRLLITVSEATREDLVELHGVDPARVRVVSSGGGEPAPAGDPEQDRRVIEHLGIEEPFVLHVGRVEPRKNQLTAARAARRADLRLVCAGPKVDPETVAALERSVACRLVGPVADGVRDALYRRALALVFPSLYEGFGFPVLEAMRHGLPVITAAVSSLPEVGGDAALYVEDPHDVEALTTEIERVRDDAELRGRLAEAGRARAATFTWERCATETAAVLREALAA